MTNPLVAQKQDSTSAISGIGILEAGKSVKDGIESGDWAATVLGVAGTAMEALAFVADPFGAILAAGVGWLIEHVGPLKEALDKLAGDPDQITAHSETWKNIAKELGAVSTDLGNQVKTDIQSWTGPGADAYRQQADDLAKMLEGAGQACDGAASGVKTAGEVVAAVRMLVRDTIAQVVGHMISWALQVLFTLGIGLAWVVPQVVNLVAKTAKDLASLMKNLTKALGDLAKLLGKAGDLFKSASKGLKGLKPGSKTTPSKVDSLPSGGKNVDPAGGGKTTPSGAKGDGPGGEKVDPPPKTGDDGTTPSGTKGDGPDGTPPPRDGDSGTPKSGPKDDGTGPSSIKDNNGSPKENSTPTDCRPGSGDPIDMTTGRMMLEESDVEVPGALPLVLRRTHFSTYRAGFRFGRTWASTVDQRLEIEDGQIGFAAEDGTLLSYPVVDGTALPVEGPYWPLKRSPEGGYVIEQPDLERMLYFAPDGAGRLPLTAIFDNDGNVINFAHDSLGNLTQIRHSGGIRIAVETSAGFVTALTLLGEDENDRTELVRYRYDQNLRLAEVINSSGLPMRYGYDDQGRLTRWIDRNGREYEFEYDELSRCVAGRGADGHLAYTFTYDRENRVNTATDSLGNTTEYHVNADFQIVRQVDPLGGETRFEWDRHDRLLATTDELGRTTRYEYDGRGNQVAVTLPDGARRLTEYDENNRVVSIVEPDGAVWRQEYDGNGHLSASIGPLGATTRYSYGEDGLLREFADEMGNRTTIECDGFGRPVATTDPLGVTTRLTYDALGRLTSETNGIGGTTRYSWTIEGGGWHRIAPDGTVLRRVFDGEGNVLEETDEQGEVTRTDYGAFDLPVTEIAPDGSRVRVRYDTELRMVAATNAEGRTWTFDYDAAGRKVREQDFDGRVLSYVYDAAGQLVARTDALGATTTFSYDVRGNVVEKRSGEQVSRFAYDPLDRLVRAVNADADVSFGYDELGRVVSETCDGRTVTSGYDLAGRRVFRRTPSGAESRWDYDGRGAPTGLAAGRHRIGFGYDAAGREIRRALGAAALSQEWDGRDRLRAQTLTTGQTVAQRRVYSLRAGSGMTGIDELIGGQRELSVDRIGRIGRVTGVRGAGVSERYSYDRSGNVVAPQRFSEQHDAQGRLVARAGWSYEWNGEDRLVAVTTPDGQRWRYRYDALGRRVAKQRMTGDAVVAETRFVWDGEVLAEQLETTAGGEVRGSTWEWSPADGVPVGQTDRVYAGGQCVDERFYAIVTDFVGTPTELVDESGQVAWHRDETLWGAPRTAATGPHTPLRFPGQYLDAETGLHYNHHRYYDPRTARYLSADPIGLSGGLDPHSYVPNPLTWSDPLGLKGGCKTGKGNGKSSLDGNGLTPDKGGKGGTSPSGLHYDLQSRYPNQGVGAGANRQEKNRLEHILLHADNDNPIPARGGRAKPEHGVWGTTGGNQWDTGKLVNQIDKGWEKVKSGDPNVQVQHQQGGRTVYTIPMDKQVGYTFERVPQRGPDGQVLRDNGGNPRWEMDANGQPVRQYRPLTDMQLVVEGKNEVITAYPFGAPNY
ncbi:RHS repeat-associated core domain-containing protein [Amycolatopsis sp. GM8]|uniref:RHS repeat-associated core domain-containing protein n=1 Tax=Amycolatopsis sp. GM8 TaxID=2896530 RepID=UPI001F465541|nr:RHS repeat-associated core domain-containing protein [Amycolatopsis sp. GM8]